MAGYFAEEFDSADSQPKDAPGINWGNPITRDLRFAWGGPDCQKDSVQGSVPTTAMPVNASKYDKGIQLNTTGLTIPHRAPKAGSKSVVIVGNPANYNGATNTYLRNGPSGGWALSVNNSGLLWTHYGVADYSLAVAASGNVGVVGVTAVPSATVTAYENGVQLASVAIGVLNASTATSCQMSLASSGSSAVSTLAFAAYWDRALSAAEHASMADNPWQIFESPPIDIWVPSAGGGVTITCTPGNAAAAGVACAVTQDISIACSVGNVVAAGTVASLPITITTSVGNAVAAGTAASVTQAVTVNTTLGNAGAAGVTAVIELGTGITINAAVGNAVAAGIAASISQNFSVACGVGNAVAAGPSAGITLSTPSTAALYLDLLSGRVMLLQAL